MEIFGFKSFANKTIVNFDKSLIGIVGPNGSGKSNISDAIRWVFGEKTEKFLRSASNDEVIFNGTKNKEPLNYCEVKLIFDNSNKVFDLDYNEVQISRRTFRGTGENDYYLNNNRVRLKDIQILAKETGMSKTSLGNISQGNINSFTNSKPNERRLLIEDAAGILKYKQRKYESLNKLERTQNNLIRLKDIINEIERQLPNLKKQCAKAIKYQNKNERLKKIEIKIILKDIFFSNKKYNELLELNLKIDEENRTLNDFISKKVFELNELEKKLKYLEDENFKFSSKFNLLIDQISNLRIKEIELKNKKYSNEYKKNNSENIILEYNEKRKIFEIEDAKFKSICEENKIYKNSINKLEQKIENENINVSLKEKQVKDIKLKISNYNYLLNNSKNLFLGVKTILKNKQNLIGIIDIFKELISFDKKYNDAFSIILSNTSQNIIVNNKTNAKDAIDFLKQNKAGRATFIPLDVKNNNFISNDEEFILNTEKGFIGIAKKLVNHDVKYLNVVNNLLSKHIICDNLVSALKIAKLINYKYTITTLDGNQIRPNGILSGGALFNKNNIFNNYENKIKNNNEKINILNSDIEYLNKNIYNLNFDKKEIENKLQQNLYLLSNIDSNKNKLQKIILDLKNEHEFLSSNKVNDKNDLYSNLFKDLKNKIIEKDKLEQKLFYLKNNKKEFYTQIEEIKTKIENKRTYLKTIIEKKIEINSEIEKVKSILNYSLNDLVEKYSMTYDNAINIYGKDLNNKKDDKKIRNEINNLKHELKKIGNVNLESINQYKEENERYLNLTKEYNNLEISISKLNKIINDMDKIMIEQFKIFINEINNNLKKTFKILFKGGSAKLIYVEPNNILNSGIEIEANPPGKKITNIKLLSGGEKSLVALSVLFAILETKKLPLVVLDEVEAPLDFVNLKIFSRYLKSFSETTQFIIVTHRVITMENCDVLYGVTMQEEGITKIFNVEVNKNKKIINTLTNEQITENVNILKKQ